MKNFSLKKEDALFLFVDVQDKLLNSAFNKEQVFKNTKILSQMANIMDMESIITLQYPKGLGQMNEEVKKSIEGSPEIAKTTFSCLLNEEFVSVLKKSGKKQIIMSGIEAHICVLLTARDLIKEGYEVFIVSDAVGSRTEFNYNNALSLLKDMGCVITNTETVMFDLNAVAGTETFKAVQKLII